MRFTKQDALTFGLGLLAALVIVLGEALIALEEQVVIDLEIWARDLLVGLGAGLGRYLVTRVPEFLTRNYPTGGSEL
ncbi:hypothetical protein LCGC14_1995150 [marine sediment metagenome]|uniref:Uncharacterized protein n=1 Tax=marine sediment metagenome TaxID=412755 RepID=A0A0F9F556_9ZZZZ